MAYFQVPWAEEHGALQTLGVEAACVSFISPNSMTRLLITIPFSIVVGLFLIFVPYVQLRGRSLRVRLLNNEDNNFQADLDLPGTVWSALRLT